jgi:tRNA/tmRNA/rRNA uracil-C5-methylase (TrmA/RlmC/RlmD family)
MARRRSHYDTRTSEAVPEKAFPGSRFKTERRGGKQPRFQKGRKPDSRDAEAVETPAKAKRFSDILMSKARAAFPDKVGPASSPEPLAHLPYERELEIKNQALQEFWTAQALPDKPNQILPSPKPRKYRITTKRRVVFEGGRFRLDFQPEKREAGQARLGAASFLEPDEHAALYAFVVEKLNTQAYASLGHALNFLVIRGDYHRFAVFFNVSKVNSQVARKAKLLAEHLQALDLRKGGSKAPRSGDAPEDAPKVASAYLFHDPERSPFYLDDRAPVGAWKLKRLFGPETVRLRVGTRSYAFKPTAFCQVNGSLLPIFLEKAEQLLKPRPEQRLLDLYCGFGFFSLHLADKYREIVGVDAAGPAIESAKDMASAPPAPGQEPRRGGPLHYHAGRIQASSLGRLLPKADPEQGPEAILLDPPRQGVESGVIRELAARKPVRVLHVFCDMDSLAREVNQWRKSGYMVAKVIPLDMFPGTDNLEVMIAFIPDQYGILNRVDAPARNPLERPARNPSGRPARNPLDRPRRRY